MFQAQFLAKSLEADSVQVRRVEGRDCLGQLWRFTVHLVRVGTDRLDEAALMADDAVLELTADGQGESRLEGSDRRRRVFETRRFHGVVAEVRDLGTRDDAHREYVLTFVPQAWESTLTTTSDVYMDMTVPEIVSLKLRRHAHLDREAIELRLDEALYPKREYVVQYGESDLSFISRLCESEGIFFFFEPKGDEEGDPLSGRDVVVLADQNACCSPVSVGTDRVEHKGASGPQRFYTGGVSFLRVVEDLTSTRRRVPRDFVSRDYNYRTPQVELLGSAKLDQPVYAPSGMRNLFGEHAKTPAEAQRLARVRAEEVGCNNRVFYGRSPCPTVRAGSVMPLRLADGEDIELLIVEVTHFGEYSAFGRGNRDDELYRCEFRAIPSASPYRPPRITPKPVVSGVITGVVQAEDDEELGAIDEEGRYRVTMLFDGITNTDSLVRGRPGRWPGTRPIRMAQPSAGRDRKFHIPLKDKTEVLITCVNGDPDRPIIVGAVPNPQTPSPVVQGNKEKSIIKVNKTQITIDDQDARYELDVDHEAHTMQVGQPTDTVPELGFGLATTDHCSVKVNASRNVFVNLLDASYHHTGTRISDADHLSVAGAPAEWTRWKDPSDPVLRALAFSKSIADVTARTAALETASVEAELDRARAQRDAQHAFVERAKEARDRKVEDAIGEHRRLSNTTAIVADIDRVVAKAEKLAQGDRFKARSADPEAHLAAATSYVKGVQAGWTHGTQARQSSFEERSAKQDHITRLENELVDLGDRLALARQEIERGEQRIAAQTKLADAELEEAARPFFAAEARVGELDAALAAARAKWDGFWGGVVQGKPMDAPDAIRNELEKMGAVGRLWSTSSKLMSSQAHRARAAQGATLLKLAEGYTVSALQREPATVGAFASPYALTTAVGSAALIGERNAFVWGAQQATMASEKDATVSSGDRAHIKAVRLVEVAGGLDVKVTASNLVDVHSNGSVHIVAHPGKEVLPPAPPYTMQLLSAGSVKLQSENLDIEQQAKLFLRLKTEKGNIELTADERDVNVTAKNDFSVRAATGKGVVEASGDLYLRGAKVHIK